MNPRLKYDYERITKNAIKARIINETENDLDIVTLTHMECLGGVEFWLYRHIFHVEPNIINAHDDFIGEYTFDEKEQAEEDFEQAAKGLLKCNYCGKWIDNPHRFAPAAVACDDCIEQGKEDQKKFFDLPLD